MRKKSTPKKTSRVALRKAWILFVLSILAYANTIPNDYAVDDVYAITRNQYTQQGIAGIGDLLGKHFFSGFLGDQEVALAGGRYRPLSLVSFAIEIELFGQTPGASHAINTLLYALLVVLLFKVYRRVFPASNAKGWLSDIVFVSMLLYSLHPVHTEVVANIKGRDEILAFGFAMLSLQAALKLSKGFRYRTAIWMMTAFFLALMSKENAAAFLIVIPLTLYWAGNKSVVNSMRPVLLLLIPLTLFAIIRYSVLGTLNPGSSSELMDNPFLQASLSERIGTILLTFGEYYRLMVFPHPLTWDYYPYHIHLTPVLSLKAIIPLLLTLALVVLALLNSRSKKIYAYGVWFYFVTFFMVSNLVFTTGVFMAERFLFMPSFGLCLGLASGFAGLHAWRGGKLRILIVSLFIIILVAFLGKTIQRNREWKDNFTLYTTDIQVSFNSAKGNNIAGQFYAYESNQVEDTASRSAYLDKALFHLQRAVEIYPEYSDAWYHLGNTWYDGRGELDSLLHSYRQVSKRLPSESNVWNNLGRLVKGRPGVEDRIKIRRLMLEIYPEHPESLSELGRLLASRNAFEEALPLLERALEQEAGDALAWETVGYVHYSQSRMDQALEAYKQAYALDPGNTRYKQNVYAILLTLGRRVEAAAYAP